MTKLLRALHLSTATTMIAITGLTIAAELNSPLKNWLAATFSHHWIGKGVIGVVVLVVVGGLCWIWPHRSISSQRPVQFVWITTLVCSVALLVFFGWLALSH